MSRESEVKVDRLVEITARIDVATEVFSLIIERAKSMLEAKFGKPASYYDAERQRVLSLAHDIFASTVTLEDIQELSKQRPSPSVMDATANREPHAPKMLENGVTVFVGDDDDNDVPFMSEVGLHDIGGEGCM